MNDDEYIYFANHSGYVNDIIKVTTLHAHNNTCYYKRDNCQHYFSVTISQTFFYIARQRNIFFIVQLLDQFKV